MRSQLTRHVFRQLIRNELYSEIRPVVQCYRRSRAPQHPPPVSRRTFFGFSRNVPKETKLAAVTPGYEVLAKLNSQLAIGARPPPVEDVVQGFLAFFRDRKAKKLPLQAIQAQNAMRAFIHLRKTNTNVEGFGLSDADIRMALQALQVVPQVDNDDGHGQLATLLYEELEKRRLAGSQAETNSGTTAQKGSALARDLQPYIRTLANSGRPEQALALVEQHYLSDLKEMGNRLWIVIIKAFIRKEREDEVLRTIKLMKSFNQPLDYAIHEAIVTHYAWKDDLKSTKRWYTALDAGTPTHYTLRVVLSLCIRTRDFEWGDTVFRNLIENPRTAGEKTKTDWGLILRWSAAKGKGVDEIERMMEIMIRRNEALPEEERCSVDITMINELIEDAMSRDDPYTAERYVGLGQRWNIKPDARTHLLQLEYRLKVGDLDGARAAYKKLQAEDTSDNRDVPLVNKLIVALCDKRQPYSTIMTIAEDLSERQVHFEPSTVAALAQLHLRRSELEQVRTLLSTHIHDYTPLEDASIRDVFVDFILDRKNSEFQAWDAYIILSPTFPETSIQIRTRLMTEFFARGRSDMGTHVFGHMRQQLNRSSRPTVDTYAECFQGIARAGGDFENLQLVHNMLKVDTEIEPDTRLHNSLMLAYIACGSASRALSFWDDIAHSREGPTYRSIQIALRACEVAPFGERTARNIWSRLKRFDIQVTREIYAAYIGALAGQGALKECIRLIETAQSDAGFKPDSLMVGTFYNASQGLHNKDQVEAWAQKAYPDVWKELLALGKTTVDPGDALEDAGMEGEMENEDLIFNREGLFNIDRDVEA